MAIFLGSNAGETIAPGEVSSSVGVIGFPKKPSSAVDIIFAGGGNDIVAGGGGNDIAALGSGDDRFIWNNGDGSDLVVGEGGVDTLEFNGSNNKESFELSASHGAALLKRDLGNIKMVLESMERIELATLGGEDTIRVKDLSSTDIEAVAIDLAGTRNGTTGDGAVDSIVLEGDNLPEFIEVFHENGKLTVDGLPTDVTIEHADANDRLRINGNDGRDVISAGTIGAGVMQFTLDGGGGNDSLDGSGGADTLYGGTGSDFVDGNGGNDVAYLGEGNDTFVWDPGDGSDIVEGGADRDLLIFNGAGANENVDIAANGERVRFFREPGNITMDLNDVELITFNALGGTDNVVIHDLTGTDTHTVNVSLASPASPITGDGQEDLVIVEGTESADTVNVASSGNTTSVRGLAATVNVSGADADQDIVAVVSGGGNDTIDASGLAAGLVQLHVVSGDGNDLITGSQGTDEITGGRGDDVAHMGAGDDTFVWAPGDGSDIVEGGDGDFDALDFIGNGANETVDITANGERVRFFRDVANVTMDLNDVERIIFSSLGGADNIHVGDLQGTDIDNVTVEMGATRDSLVGDGAKDVVTVDGSAADDTIDVSFADGVADVNLLHTFVNLLGIESGDELVVRGGAGNDTLSGLNVQAGAPSITFDGGAEDDVILGSDNVDLLLGGDGADIIDGNRGDDVARMGAGDDRFIWDPGEGSDVVEGESGFDSLEFNGAGVNEAVELSADGERARFFRQPGNITMDLNDVENVTFNALGGADTIVIRDLTGTHVQEVTLSLANEILGTTPDGQLDRVTVEATGETDFIEVLGLGDSLAVIGAPAFVNIDHFDATDELTIKGGNGDDQISASTLLATSMRLTIDGGAGDDTLFGGAGADTLIGGDGDDFVDGRRGDDVALLGAGDDIFIWNPGDGSDTIEGGEGTDFMGFRGANASETIDITANGERVTFFRDVANITMDLNDVERVTFNAFGGADTINIGDLSGTDMQRIELSLIGGSGQANDTLQDSINIAGSSGNDVVEAFTENRLTTIAGLHAEVQITGADAGLDRLQIDLGAGDDIIDASGMEANLYRLSLLAGAGDDVVTGSAGDDSIDGGAGDDVLLGGRGNDVLIGGDGDDVLVGGLGDDTFIDINGTIQGFAAGAGSQDRLDLRVLGLGFDELMSHASDVGSDVVFDFGDDELTLTNLSVTQLHQDDFILA